LYFSLLHSALRILPSVVHICRSGQVCCFTRLQSDRPALQCVKQLSSSFIMATKCFFTPRNAQNP
jgi:hypothetical protein